MPSLEQVRVGVGVFILQTPSSQDPKNPTFLIGKRKGAHGAGTYALPGGHLEFGESWEECASREVLEETGLEITHVRFLTATNSVFVEDGKHYVTIFMVCRRSDGDGGKEARVMEPEKCEGWEWCSWERLREMVNAESNGGNREVFLPLRSLMEQREGVVPGL